MSKHTETAGQYPVIPLRTEVQLPGHVGPLEIGREASVRAIEAATREKLRIDYQQRLDATSIESHRLLDEQAILQKQIAEIDASLPALEQAAEQAGKAYAAHNVDSLTLTNIEGALLARRLERIAARQALQEQAIALQALLGTSVNLPERSTGASRTHLVEHTS